MAQKDYPELEGKKVIVKQGNTIAKAVVAGCNYDIGLTVTLTEDVNHLNEGDDVICLNGPSSPHWGNSPSQNIYPADFYSTVRGIKKGTVSLDMLMLIDTGGGIGGNLACPFNA